MPWKDKEVRNARQREKYAQIKAEDPEYVAKQAEKDSEAFKKKYAEDEAYREKRKATFKKWYDLHGKENARERKGYKPLEEYLVAEDEKARKHREYMKEWGKTQAGKRGRTARSIKDRCGLDINEYDLVYDAQNGQCTICKKEKPRYGKDRLVVDHCHMSGKFRALLCANCNSAIGLLGESEEIMINAIAYLRSLRELKE